ncbi:MAG: MFS transporter permease, partial [Spirulinaceae cyanobacterium]
MLSPTRILWLRVLGLAAMQGAITLTWVIYGTYLPKMLVQFGFAAGFAAVIIIVEQALAIIFEPLFGAFSDRTQ